MTVEDDINAWFSSNIDTLFPAPPGQEAEYCAEASWRVLAGLVRAYPGNKFTYGPNVAADTYYVTLEGAINHTASCPMNP